MPLVSPVLGVTDVEWTHVWVVVLMGMEVDFTRTPFGPICRAPKSDGTLCEQSATSSEIADFLNSILGLSGSSYVTSHSLKRTTLAWASKYMVCQRLQETCSGITRCRGNQWPAIAGIFLLDRYPSIRVWFWTSDVASSCQTVLALGSLSLVDLGRILRKNTPLDVRLPNSSLWS